MLDRSRQQALRSLNPSLRISNVEDLIPLRRPEHLARLAEGLRKAGPTARPSAESFDIYSRSIAVSNFEIGSSNLHLDRIARPGFRCLRTFLSTHEVTRLFHFTGLRHCDLSLPSSDIRHCDTSLVVIIVTPRSCEPNWLRRRRLPMRRRWLFNVKKPAMVFHALPVNIG